VDTEGREICTGWAIQLCLRRVSQPAISDQYRVDKGQQPTFDQVMRGLEMLKKHGVEFNTLSSSITSIRT
jgi:hypothetical protein